MLRWELEVARVFMLFFKGILGSLAVFSFVEFRSCRERVDKCLAEVELFAKLKDFVLWHVDMRLPAAEGRQTS